MLDIMNFNTWNTGAAGRKHNPYLFDMPCKPGVPVRDIVSGVELSANIPGSRYRLNPDTGLIESVAPNTPAIERDGLRMCPEVTQLTKMSEILTDATWSRSACLTPYNTGTLNGSNIWHIPEDTNTGSHIFFRQLDAFNGAADNSIIGARFLFKEYGRNIQIAAKLKTGSLVVVCNIANGVVSNLYSGAFASVTALPDGFFDVFVAMPCNSGVNIPIIYAYLRNGTVTSYTGDGISGVYVSQPTYINFGVNGIPFIPPYVPNSTTSPVAVVAETSTSTTGMSFDLDDAKLANLNKAFRGPNGQGHLEVGVVVGTNSSWLSNSTSLNILSCFDKAENLLFFRKDSSGNNYIRLSDSSATYSGISPTLSLTVGQIVKLVADWGYLNGVLKMRLKVNGVASSIVNFSGSFGSQDLRFGFNSPANSWIKNLKFLPRPIW